MSTITVADGTAIYNKDWGNGQPIVFSHGWPLSSGAWAGQMLFFAQHGYRVIARDRRGFGSSTQTVPRNEMDSYADDLAAVMDQLDVRDAVLVGHSTGAAKYLTISGGTEPSACQKWFSFPQFRRSWSNQTRIRTEFPSKPSTAYAPVLPRIPPSSTKTSLFCFMALIGPGPRSRRGCSTRSGS
jgi:predicted alpha/beta hydrolase